jgi:hypothetical protein
MDNKIKSKNGGAKAVKSTLVDLEKKILDNKKRTY